MKCDIHPDNDTVGNCAYCGRPVCNDCKETHDNILHCFQCVKQGRIVDRPSLDWQAFFYYLPQPGIPESKLKALMGSVLTPYPSEEPDPRPFKIGLYGAITAGLMALFTGTASLAIQDMFVMLGLNIVLFIATLPLLMGIYGFNKNYGCKLSMAASWGLAIFLMLLMLVNIYDNINVLSGIKGSLLTFTVGYSLLGIGYLLVGLSLFRLRGFFVRGIMLRNFLTWISTSMMVGSLLIMFSSMILPQIIEIDIIFLTLFYILGWVIISIGLLGLYIVFRAVPLPERVVDKISDDQVSILEQETE